MRKARLAGVICIMVIWGLQFVSCDSSPAGTEDIASGTSDLDKLAAAKNVTYSYNNLTLEIGLPADPVPDTPFDSLLLQDSARYSDKSNYTIGFILNLTADNTHTNAKDAKLDGMDVDVHFGGKVPPVAMEAPAFEVKKDSTLPVAALSSINLETHTEVGKYIFRQIADGNDLATKDSLTLYYKIGALEGSFQPPYGLEQNIPTTATPEMKNFLNGLLNSSVLD